MLYNLFRKVFFPNRGRNLSHLPDRVLEEAVKIGRLHPRLQIDDIDAALELEARAWFRDFIGKSIVAWIALFISVASFILTASMKVSESSDNHKSKSNQKDSIQQKEEPKPKGDGA